MNQLAIKDAHGWGRRDTLLVVLAGAVALWTHRLALIAFFTSPDDLTHLQQAVGLKPTLPTPFRFLSQVVYFRLMMAVFGPNALAFHAVTLLLHVANVALVYTVARTAGVDRRTAAFASALFGVFPLHFTLLSSAVGINDELALALALASLLALQSSRSVLACVLFALGLFCKESVVFLPFLALFFPDGPTIGSRLKRIAPLVAVAAVCVVVFLALQPVGLASGGAVYAARLGPNVFHNLMTYASWAVNLRDPLPDLVSSYDPSAWRIGVWILICTGFSWLMFRRSEAGIGFGSAWALLGILPVIALEHQTYRHYLYPAVPGVALIAGGTTVRLLETAWRTLLALGNAKRSGDPRVSNVINVVLTLLALAYALRAEHLVRTRVSARLPGIDLALDPVQRRREVAGRAISDLGAGLGPDVANVAILSPLGAERFFGARSGREFDSPADSGRAYDLLEESVDYGGGFKLFYRQIDSVAFLRQWTPAYRDFSIYLPYEDGHLYAAGAGEAAHREIAGWMMEQGWYPQTRDHLASALKSHPSNSTLRLAYAAALYRSGDSDRAVGELQSIIRDFPDDSAAVLAQASIARIRAASVRR